MEALSTGVPPYKRSDTYNGFDHEEGSAIQMRGLEVAGAGSRCPLTFWRMLKHFPVDAETSESAE